MPPTPDPVRGPAPARTCGACGAPATIASASHCAFCGAELPLPVAAPTGPVETRFGALAVHPAAERARATRPAGARKETEPADGPLLIGGCALALLGSVALVGVVFVAADAIDAPDALPMAVAASLVLIVAAALLISVARPGRQPGIPVEPPGWRDVRILGVSVDEVGPRDFRRLVHLAQLETRDGQRRRVEIRSEHLAEGLAHNDMGVVWIEDDALVEFVRIDV